MSGGPSYHGWTHRPASQGGTDPLDVTITMPYAALARSGSVSVGSGTSYNTDTYPDWTAFGSYHASAYMEQMTDGSGVEGLKFLQTGVYSITSYVQIRENNGSDIVPPTLRWMITSCRDGATDFSTANGFQESLNGGWFSHNPAGTGLAPPDILPLGKSLTLGGCFVYPLTTSLLSSFDSITCRLVSLGGTADWMWYPAALYVIRLGDVYSS